MLEMKNIKRCDSMRRFISRIVEQEREEKGLIGQEVFRSLNAPLNSGAQEPAANGKS